jgi:dTDP-4-dehydrorhamnose 3,5-epimerase
MEFKSTGFEGLVEIQPKVFGDERGYFYESFNQKLFAENGINENFVQDNQSFSNKNVLGGLHLHKEPFAQGKLVRVITGKVLDVVVDIRQSSRTFGKWYSVILDAEKQNMLYVPPGFAHGFATLEDAIFSYKCTNLYNKASEGGIVWNDPDLKIDWIIKNPLVNLKDQELPTFKNMSYHS